MTAETTPHEALALALADAVDRGLLIPCAGSEAWTSEDPDDRAAAALECAGCPAWDACAVAGEGQVWGVWAGVWRGLTPGPAGRPRKARA
jgi:hypothetical protein